MKFDELSPELKTKLEGCKSADELKAIIEAEGLELSDDELVALSGGVGGGCYKDHPECRLYDEVSDAEFVRKF